MHQQGNSSESSFVAMVASFVLHLLYKDTLSDERKSNLKVHFISSVMTKK